MVTVILCSYHGGEYLDAQRRSILSQQTEVPFELREYDDEIRRSGSAANNFLSAIREAPASEYYMLSDQDDLWHRDKIDKLYQKISGIEAACGRELPILVFSDACVVDDKLNEIAPSFVKYEGLTPDRVALPQLLVMNQVTGAACIFNHALKRLLEIHPMPEHAVIHDQWIAMIAAAFGRIEYLDEALYDYRQHSSNVLGAKRGDALSEGIAMTLKGHAAASRAAYDALSRQAGEFLEQYRGMLNAEQTDILRNFALLPGLSKAERVRIVLKYGFTYNRLYRTMGELINI